MSEEPPNWLSMSEKPPDSRGAWASGPSDGPGFGVQGSGPVPHPIGAPAVMPGSAGGPQPPPPVPPDDRLTADDPFDPAQWAMHGVLSAYYAQTPGRNERRAAEILARARAHHQSPSGSEGPLQSPERQRGVPVESLGAIQSPSGSEGPLPSPEHQRRVRVATRVLRALRRRARWLIGSGLAAAILVGFFLIHAGPHGIARAEACFLAGGGITDPEDITVTEARIRTNRQERDEITVLGTDAACAGIPKIAPRWNRIIRDLRDLGRFDEALSEAEAARRCSRECKSWDWEFVLLADIGAIHARQGRFDEAREAFLASIDARNRVSGDPNEPSERGRAAKDAECHTLGPLYRLLACVGISVGDLGEARRWQGRAEEALRYALRRRCERAQVSFAADASLTQLWHLAFGPARGEIDRVTAADGPWEGLAHDAVSLAAKLREHLLVEARLRRLEQNLDGAEQAMKDAESLPYSPRMDESRMDFTGPMESARIAIARRDCVAALAAAEEASTHTGWVRMARPDEDPVAVDRPPIGPLARAELDLLHGVALLGVGRDDRDVSEGHALVEQALYVPRQMAAGMNDDQRTAFLRQFRAWEELGAATRQRPN